MFGWEKKSVTPPTPPAPTARPARDPSEDGPIIAALLLSDEQFRLADVQGRVAAAAFVGHRPTRVEITKGILAFQLEAEVAGLTPIPKPYPWSDLQGPCATSWLWPKQTPASSLKEHRSHVLVTMVGGRANRVTRRLMLMQLTGLAAQEPNVVGIYWPDAGMVHFPPPFIQMAQKFTSPEAPPLYMMVDFRVLRNRDGSLALFTAGLRPLGLMEIEIPKTVMQQKELREWVMNIAYYLLKRGSPIPDGDTIGMTADQQIRVRHLPSLYGHQGTVMRFET